MAVTSPMARLPDQLPKTLDDLGITPLTLSQINATHQAVLGAIRLGVSHPNAQAADQGGADAFLTQVQPLRSRDWRHIPEGTRVALANFGGYNWQVGFGYRHQNRVKVEITKEQVFPEQNRRFANPKAFAQTMLALLLDGTKGQKLPVLGISFGFQHEGLKTPYGLDALVPVDAPAKHWEIKGLANTRMGKLLQEVAKEKFGWNLTQVYLVNDTIATALGILDSRLGFVGGEGTNGCFAHPKDNQGQFINGELGRLTVFPKTKLVDELIRTHRVPSQDHGQLAEYFSGGNYLIKQLLMAVSLLKDSFPIPVKLPENPNSAWVSRLALNQETDLAAPTQLLLAEIAGRILARAGQTMGLFMAGMVAYVYPQSFPGKIIIPAVGSVLFKGTGVLPACRRTLKTILGSQAKMIRIQESSDLQGVAHLALIESHPRA
jgi:hypothetical protein